MEEKNNFVRVRKHKKKDHANYLSPLAPMAVFRLCFFHLKEEVCETLDLMCSSCHLEYMYFFFLLLCLSQCVYMVSYPKNVLVLPNHWAHMGPYMNDVTNQKGFIYYNLLYLLRQLHQVCHEGV